jgi:hypothetical protein
LVTNLELDIDHQFLRHRLSDWKEPRSS